MANCSETWEIYKNKTSLRCQRSNKKATQIAQRLYLQRKNLLSNLAAILLRFRLRETAVDADFEKAFHKIIIARPDRDYLRFFLLQDFKNPVSGDNLRLFHFRMVPFGIIESPFLFAATIIYQLEKYPNEFTD